MCIRDSSYSADRKLDRQLLLELATGNYIQKAQNVNIFGPTGAGKSYLGQALGNAACRQGISTRYIQLTELLDQFRIAAVSYTHLGFLVFSCLSACLYSNGPDTCLARRISRLDRPLPVSARIHKVCFAGDSRRNDRPLDY